MVEADDDALVGLDGDDAIRALLAVDGVAISADAHELVAVDDDTRGAGEAGVAEVADEVDVLVGLEVEVSGLGPELTLETDDGALLDATGGDELSIEIRLPGHFEIKELVR